MRIAVIGCGVMGEALMAGMLRNFQPTPTVVVAERREERLAELQQQYGVAGADLDAACAAADVVLLAVKPFDAKDVLAQLAPTIPQGAVVISVVAGLATADMEALVPHAHIVRAMPNTPARIEAGVTGISGGVHCPIESVELALRLLSAVGAVIHVPEDLQDAVTSVSGSGPAYVFYLAEAMLAGAREGGLSEEAAHTAVVQTILGAAKLMEWSGTDPAVLRANVTTPNGTTAAAIATFEAADMRGTVVQGIAACRARSRELSQT